MCIRDSLDGLNGSRNVGAVRQDQQPGRRGAGRPDIGGGNEAPAVRRHLDHRHPSLLQGAQRASDGVVLHAGGHHPVAGAQQAEEGDVQRFGGTGGEGDAGGVADAEETGHRLPGFEQEPGRLQGKTVTAAAGARPDVPQGPVDRGKNGRGLGK